MSLLLIGLSIGSARAAPPANDAFANAIVVGPALPVNVTGTTAEATAEATEADYTTEFETLSPLSTVWYRWTPSANASVDLRTEGTLDTVLGVFTGSSVGALTAVGVNDQTPLGTGGTSRVTFNAVAGTTYRIMVDAYTPGDQGPFVLTLATVVRPPNDNYASRPVLSAGGLPRTLVASNINATAEASEAMVLGEAATSSVWWQWSNPSVTRVEIVATNASFNTRVAVFTGTSLPGTKVAEGAGRVRFSATANTAYKIAVDGLNAEEGTFDLTLRTAPAAPSNDNFPGATITGSLPITVAGSTAGASGQVNEPFHAGFYPWASIWYSWTPAVSGRMEFETFGSAIDTSLAVYTGATVGGLTARADNDDAAGTVQSRIRMNVTANTTYRIAVDCPGFAEGAIALHIRSAPVAPANDNLSSATVLGSGLPATSSGTNVGASAEAGEPPHDPADGQPYASIWYRWTATSNTWVVADTAGSALNTVLAVYTNNVVSNLTWIASADDDGTNATSRVEFFARSGVTYQLAVDGRTGLEGAVQIRLANAPPLPPFAITPLAEGDLLRLTIPARANRTYQLWEGPAPDQLTVPGPVYTAFGEELTFDVFPETTNGFYRVEAVDPPEDGGGGGGVIPLGQ